MQQAVYPLDEALISFATAIDDNDLFRANESVEKGNFIINKVYFMRDSIVFEPVLGLYLHI